MEEHEQIQLRSDEVEDILGRPPSWIVRWGITIIFLTLISLGVLSWLVQYSDVIEATIVVTTPSPPMNIVSQTSGRLLQLNVENEGQVVKDDLIAVIESTADYDDMIWLDNKVQKSNEKQIPFSASRTLKLGEVQLAYSNYMKDYKDYSIKISGSFEKQQVEQIFQMVKTIGRKIRIAEDKKENLNRDIELASKTIRRTHKLKREGAASDQNVEDAQANFNRLESGLEDIRSEIVGYDTEIERLEAQRLRIQQGKVDGGNERLIRLMDSLNKLAAAIVEWKKMYLITAPVDGKITLFDIRAEQQYINSGQEIMMIIPKQGEILGRVELPVTGAGKVEKGDVVNILLHEYPSKEFGVVKGEIKQISLLPKNDKYLVEVGLPNGLITTYKKELEFKQEMSGIAEIITDKNRFIYRIFDQFKDLFNNKG
ncbi:MAG: multidrug resistance efflux pump [Maribacter sp.]|jgi:multidrug resistance efflux pump